MATYLTEYNTLKTSMTQQAAASGMSLEQLMVYQELLYRIEVLETCQTLCKSAPATTNVPDLCGHYKLVDAYILCMMKERRLGQPAEQKLKEQRETAFSNFDRVVTDCRKRFSSFQPSAPEQYKTSIGRMINTVLPVWLQFRNTYINIARQGGASHESE